MLQQIKTEEEEEEEEEYYEEEEEYYEEEIVAEEEEQYYEEEEEEEDEDEDEEQYYEEEEEDEDEEEEQYYEDEEEEFAGDEKKKKENKENSACNNLNLNIEPALVAITRQKRQHRHMAVQAHGFLWEDEIKKIYGATAEEIASIKYTAVYDLPAAFNRTNQSNVSVKSTGKADVVCMGDCLRVFDTLASASPSPYHMVVIYYQQVGEVKRVKTITEILLTGAQHLLFGTVTRAQLQELNDVIKTVPAKRSPTAQEHARIYSLRNKLQAQGAALHFDPKCNSQQSRLQCSFNNLQLFLKEHPERIIYQSNSSNSGGGVNSVNSVNAFYGGHITQELPLGCRQLKKKKKTTNVVVATETNQKSISFYFLPLPAPSTISYS